MEELLKGVASFTSADARRSTRCGRRDRVLERAPRKLLDGLRDRLALRALALRERRLPQDRAEGAPAGVDDAFSHRDEYDEVADNAQSYFDRESSRSCGFSRAFAASLVAAMLEAF